LAATGGGADINTADIERLNATCRASLAPLVRQGRAIAHTETLLSLHRPGNTTGLSRSLG
jgi:hypothetical protein